MVEGVVTGTIIGEALFNALRRMGHEDASARRLLTEEEIAPSPTEACDARHSPPSVRRNFPETADCGRAGG